MPLDKAQVRFAVAVACLAEALLGEKAGPEDDTCPQGDPECLFPLMRHHEMCQYAWRGTDPDPRAAR